jgi:hypothetical protein
LACFLFVFGCLFFFLDKQIFDKNFFLFMHDRMVLEKPQNSSVFCTLRTKREREKRDEYLYLSAFL